MRVCGEREENERVQYKDNFGRTLEKTAEGEEISVVIAGDDWRGEISSSSSYFALLPAALFAHQQQRRAKRWSE